MDEAGFVTRDDYPYGYSLKGTRCYALKSGKRVARVSWIAALKEGKVFAPLTYEGCAKSKAFLVVRWRDDLRECAASSCI